MDSESLEVSCLRALVGFNTVATPDHNGSYERDFPAAISYMKAFVSNHVRPGLFSFEEIEEKEKDGVHTGRSSLIIKLGPQDKRGILLSGHYDVIPVSEQLPIDPTGADPSKWHTNPFTLAEKDGIYYGRGANDMKGSVACMLASIPYWSRDFPHIPITIVLTCDEEKGMAEVRNIIAQNNEEALFKKPLACIVTEPTVPPIIDKQNSGEGMAAVVAHKGSMTAWFNINGIGVHASQLPYGVSALEYGIRVCQNIRNEFNEIISELEPDTTFYPATPTMNISSFRSGEACNIVPAHAKFEIEIRYMPGHAPTQFLDRFYKCNAGLIEEMREEFAKRGFVLHESPVTISKPNGIISFELSTNSPLYSMLSKEYGADNLQKAPAGTEASYWSNAGIDTVIIGAGSMRTAHMANEQISRTQLAEGVEFFCNKVPQFYNALVAMVEG